MSRLRPLIALAAVVVIAIGMSWRRLASPRAPVARQTGGRSLAEQTYRDERFNITLRLPGIVAIAGLPPLSGVGPSPTVFSVRGVSLNALPASEQRRLEVLAHDLQEGTLGPDASGAHSASQMVTMVAGRPARLATILSRSPCDARLEQVVEFFHRDRFVTLSLQSPIDSIAEEFPDAFERTIACVGARTWKSSLAGSSLLASLSRSDIPSNLKNWPGILPKILGTIELR